MSQAKPKRPRGRPKVANHERRTGWLMRLKPDELALIRKAAKAKGMTASGWARGVLMRAAKRVTGKR